MKSKIAIRVTVTAGTITDKAVPEHTKQWEVTAEGWDSADRVALVRAASTAAFSYAKTLQQGQFNWVYVKWLWMR